MAPSRRRRLSGHIVAGAACAVDLFNIKSSAPPPLGIVDVPAT